MGARSFAVKVDNIVNFTFTALLLNDYDASIGSVVETKKDITGNFGYFGQPERKILLKKGKWLLCTLDGSGCRQQVLENLWDNGVEAAYFEVFPIKFNKKRQGWDIENAKIIEKVQL